MEIVEIADRGNGGNAGFAQVLGQANVSLIR
jgi:hypothetical protein